MAILPDPPLGIGILHLVAAPESAVKDLVARLVRRAKDEIADREQGRKVIELAEELLIRRFSTYQREENRKMFKLANIRDTAVWKEAHEEGKVLAKQEMVRNCMANGLSLKQVAKLLKLPLKEVRRLAK